MGQIENGIAKEEGMYSLKMQSKYNGSDHERRGKGRRNVQPEDTEQV